VDGTSAKAVKSAVERENVEPIFEALMVLSSETKTKMGTIHVLEDDSQFIHFFDSAGQRIKLNAEDVLITEKTANIYKLDIGDDIRVRVAADHFVDFKVTVISKVNIGQGVYLSKQAWEEHGLTFSATALLSADNKMEPPVEIVSRVVDTSVQSQDFMTSMNSTLSLSVMMIGAAAVLAFIVLYNLGMLNFLERERDLATLLVLGFHPRELRSFVVFENIVFSIVGIIIGIPAGFALHRIIFSNAGMGDELDFSTIILNNSVIVSVLFTFFIAVAVNIIVLTKVKRIHMVEALKSVE